MLQGRNINVPLVRHFDNDELNKKDPEEDESVSKHTEI